MTSKHTTNRSERDITKKFNLAEFNRIFEQNLILENKKIKDSQELTIQCPEKSQNNSQNNTLFIIICIIIIIGIFLLLIENFIKVKL